MQQSAKVVQQADKRDVQTRDSGAQESNERQFPRILNPFFFRSSENKDRPKYKISRSGPNINLQTFSVPLAQDRRIGPKNDAGKMGHFLSTLIRWQ
ncbi:hypothetical protein Hanom_Chr12g01106771 [Helianthus anomalus]